MRPVEPDVPGAPFPLEQMTTAEISRYRREIEGALSHGPSGLPAGAPARIRLEAKLSAIADEEARRAELAAKGGRE